jgi:hypothetical protein
MKSHICKKKEKRSHRGVGPRAYARENPFSFALVFQDHTKSQGKENTQIKGYKSSKINR